MTEAQIESRVSRMVDRLDKEYLSTSMSRDIYEARIKQIDEWAWLKVYEARLAGE